MITVEELKAAIAECEGERNPNANTCLKLSAYHILLREKQGQAVFDKSYSYDSEPTEKKVDYYSDTEFSKVVNNKTVADVYAVIDELMTVIQALKPNLYDGTMRKLREIS